MTINTTRKPRSGRPVREICAKAFFVMAMRAGENLSEARSVASAGSTISSLEIKPLKSDLDHPFLTRYHTDLTTADFGP